MEIRKMAHGLNPDDISHGSPGPSYCLKCGAEMESGIICEDCE